jgi:hypothetical protein
MKQFIVLLATTVLGLAIYGMIAGAGEGSLMSETRAVWMAELENKASWRP